MSIISPLKNEADRYWRLILEIHTLRERLKGLSAYPEFEQLNQELTNLKGDRHSLTDKYLEDLERAALVKYEVASNSLVAHPD